MNLPIAHAPAGRAMKECLLAVACEPWTGWRSVCVIWNAYTKPNCNHERHQLVLHCHFIMDAGAPAAMRCVQPLRLEVATRKPIA